MTRGQKLAAMRNYVVANRTDAVMGADGTLTFESEGNTISTTQDDLNVVRREIEEEIRKRRLSNLVDGS